MKTFNRAVLLIILVFACSVDLFAQTRNTITEDEVPIKIIAFFYGEYENAEEVKWDKIIDDGTVTYEGSYQYNGNKVIALYNDKNRILKEERQFTKSLITPSMKMKAAEVFPDAKIDYLRRIVQYNREAKVEKSVYYELVVKKKRTRLSVYFDQDQQYVQNESIANLANN